MPHVAALYRYPVKGCTPEACAALTVLTDGRVAGDRVLGLRFADNVAADDAWSQKAGMLVLMNTPEIARLQIHYDDQARRLRIDLDGRVLADESIDGAGRSRIAAAVQEFALGLEETPVRELPEHLPLRLVGDGVTPRYHDVPAGEVTLHGRGSLTTLAKALGDADVDELRFRSNIAVEDLEPWEELSWVGGAVRIGNLTFEVSRAKVRCLATHANPTTGARDRQVLTTLTHSLGQEQPTFAVALRSQGEGVIRVGDEVELVRAPAPG